ncbi:hypothetical protein ANO11243_068090 [Dothideomycetidae sp. 11243]|nr:hypothetical protein ANO11243_068090 [fungal sp. No.11243]
MISEPVTACASHDISSEVALADALGISLSSWAADVPMVKGFSMLRDEQLSVVQYYHDSKRSIATGHRVEKARFRGADVLFEAGGSKMIMFCYKAGGREEQLIMNYDLARSLDLEGEGLTDLQDFKIENSVYLKALTKDAKASRLKYETECNEIAWKIAYTHPEFQSRRGVLQQAVDAYRNNTEGMESRRVKRQRREHARSLDPLHPVSDVSKRKVVWAFVDGAKMGHIGSVLLLG